MNIHMNRQKTGTLNSALPEAGGTVMENHCKRSLLDIRKESVASLTKVAVDKL